MIWFKCQNQVANKFLENQNDWDMNSRRNVSSRSIRSNRSIYSNYNDDRISQRNKIREMTARNTENLKQSNDFKDSANALKNYFYKFGLKVILELKRQFSIAQKESFRDKRISGN